MGRSGARGQTVSIRDVARAAGVSITTVSHALHDTGYVAARTRAHVQRVAAQVDYQPNRLARGLRTQRTMTVGMLVSHLRNPLVASYVEGVEAVFRRAGYGLVLASTHLEQEEEQRGLELVQQTRADGLIVAAPSPWLLARLPVITAERPVALINARPPAISPELSGAPEPPGPAGTRRPIVAAVVDEERVGYEVTAHLLGLGHRRVALLQRAAPLWNFQQRLAGYRRALEEARIPFDPTLVLEHEPPEAPAAALAARLRSLPDAPTAAFAAHNLVALRLVEALQDAGVRIPEGLSLVVSAEEDWTRVVQPRLSAVEFPGRELGAAAARLLLEALRQTERPPRPVDSHGRHRMPVPDVHGAAGEKSGKNGADEAGMPPLEHTQLEHTVEILTAPLAVRASSAPPSSTRSARVPGSAAGAEAEEDAP